MQAEPFVVADKNAATQGMNFVVDRLVDHLPPLAVLGQLLQRLPSLYFLQHLPFFFGMIEASGGWANLRQVAPRR
jgi:hypothetical protein